MTNMEEEYDCIREDAESADRQEFEDMLEELGVTAEEWQAAQDRLQTELDAQRSRQ